MSRLWAPARAERAARSQLLAYEVAANPAAVEEAFANGVAQGRADREAGAMTDRAVLAQLIEAAATLEFPDPEPLIAQIADTVVRLVADIAGAAPVDPVLLRERALALVETVRSSASAVQLVVHPDSLAMLAGLREDIVIVADPAIPLGTLRLIGGDGWLEDGVAAALDRLHASAATMGSSL